MFLYFLIGFVWVLACGRTNASDERTAADDGLAGIVVHIVFWPLFLFLYVESLR